MSKKENKHPYVAGTEHGYISFGEVNTYANEIEACKLQSGPDGGRPVSYTHLTLPTILLV